jgi:hypothetical protein
MTRNNVFGFVLPLVLALILWSGCKKDESAAGPAATNFAQVMVIHASPDAPAVDAYVDGVKLTASLSYLQSTGYLQVPAGTRRVEIKLAGTATTVYTDSATVQANTYYSVFGGGLVANFKFYPFIDTLSQPAAGKANVRFVHMGPDAPAVDVWEVGGSKLVTNVSFGEATGFAPLDARTYSFDIRQTGSSTPGLQVTNLTFQAGKIYTVYARGLVAGTGATALGATVIVNR